ncbi:MAG TPA: hypothetical protein VFN49_03020 [Candidatus Aquilonibacter sp.]|nr:hypothetical protein [Candidatus Aquilonibacter sp.]
MLALILTFRPQRLRMVSRPMLQISGDRQFLFRPQGTCFGQPLAFEWESLDATIPSLRGTIALYRLGPAVLLVVKAAYRVGEGIAGRLLEQSVGKAYAARSLRYLCNSLTRVIERTPERALLKR